MVSTENKFFLLNVMAMKHCVCVCVCVFLHTRVQMLHCVGVHVYPCVYTTQKKVTQLMRPHSHNVTLELLFSSSSQKTN